MANTARGLLNMKYRGLKQGDRVRSSFRAPWVGVVYGVVSRKDTTPLIYVLVTHDKNGRKLLKPFKRKLDGAHLTKLD